MDIVDNASSKTNSDPLKLWDKAKTLVKDHIGEVAFNTWFGAVKPKIKDSANLIIEVPDNFFKEWFCNHYLELLKEIMRSLTKKEVALEVATNPGLIKKKEKGKLEVLESRISQRPPDEVTLNPKYTFENFIVGPSNRFTHAACLSVAEQPAKNYNPLFIYGKVGLGKTHLMQAICHFVKKKNPHVVIKYITAEKFTNELINGIHRHSMNIFRQKYRNTDILLLDDIHFIAGKEATQEEFFHTFNTLKDNHKQIIISSDRSPKEIQKLEERLISRFSWGLITDVQVPDFETRVAILKKKLENETTPIPDTVIFFIAESITNNIRELEGALIRLIAYAVFEEKQIDLAMAQDILKDMLRETIKTITIDTIQKKVAHFYGLTVLDLRTKRRNRHLVLARQIAMYLARELTSLSLPEIGQVFGSRDHTTVLHSYNKIKELNKKDVPTQQTIQRIITEIKGG